jgi:hypothetical protein
MGRARIVATEDRNPLQGAGFEEASAATTAGRTMGTVLGGSVRSRTPDANVATGYWGGRRRLRDDALLSEPLVRG